jgi:histidinol-phosphate aminotransferase
MTPRFPREDYRSLSLYAPDRRPIPVDLTDNTNRWGAHPAALAAVRGADDDALTRYPDLYAEQLKAAISRRYGVPVASIVTGCGSDGVLDHAFRAAGPEGGRVNFPGPTFLMIEPFSRVNGRRPVEIPWSLALEEPAALFEGDPVIVYVCRPNNPTGSLAPRAWLEEVLRAAEGRAGPLVVLDEAYADFAGESLIREAPERPNLLVARTLSKAFGLAGLRVGFAVGRPEVVLEVEKSRGPYAVNRLAERAGVAALDDVDGWAARTIEECLANRARLAGELEARGLVPLPSEANFLFFRVPDGSARAWNDGLRAHGVAVRPFPACPDVGDGMRVSIAPWPMLERFLDAVDAVLAEGRVPAPPGATAGSR